MEQKAKPSKDSTSRRSFLVGGAALVGAAASIGNLEVPLFEAPLKAEAYSETAGTYSETAGTDDILGPQTPQQRAETARKIKLDNAQFQFKKPIPNHPNNGDEVRFPSKVGNFHKGLPTINEFGEVDLAAYGALIHALTTGNYSDFEAIPLGGTAKLVDPKALILTNWRSRPRPHWTALRERPRPSRSTGWRWREMSPSPNTDKNLLPKEPSPISTALALSAA